MTDLIQTNQLPNDPRRLETPVGRVPRFFRDLPRRTPSLGFVIVFILTLLTAPGCGGGESSDGGADSGGNLGNEAGTLVSARSPRNLREFKAMRDSLDEVVWPEEALGENYRRAITQLWDDLRAKDPFTVLSGFPFETIRLGVPSGSRELAPNLVEYTFEPGGETLDPRGWRALVERYRAVYDFDYSEWQHASFDSDAADTPQSRFEFSIHLTAKDRSSRVEIRGDLGVSWSEQEDAYLNKKVKSLDAGAIQVQVWSGDSAFREAFVVKASGHQDVPPVLAHDLDGDGFSEIVYPGTNALYQNKGGFEFELTDFCSYPLQNSYESVIADFDGDGIRDYLTAGIGEGTQGTTPSLYLYKSDANGRFTLPPRKVFPRPFEGQSCFAVGDIDQDGDLDLYVGKYIPPYVHGQMPTPFYDANDSNPANLLINDGVGNFHDAIAGSGLEAKGRRRMFRCSFVDFDDDGDLDLLTTNDFYGIDLFTNDGTGSFTDVTATHVDEPANFGMSHTMGDYDLDGTVDLYVTGMYSHTVRRLVEMGLRREDRPDVYQNWERMGYGSRVYSGQAGGQFRAAPFADDLANSGWSWGVTSFDPDLDGDLDVFVANGHVSGETVRDYDSHYWRHDIYLGKSNTDPILSSLFLNVMTEMGRSYSWNGYESNRLYLNSAGSGFDNVGHVLGVADDLESRQALSEDLDRDGRPDLIVGFQDRIANEKGFWVFRNHWPGETSWVGVDLIEGRGQSTLGAKVEAVTSSGTQTVMVLAGDSFFSQHSNSRQFGVPDGATVERIEVTWPGGKKSVLESPAVGIYHRVDAPNGGRK